MLGWLLAPLSFHFFFGVCFPKIFTDVVFLWSQDVGGRLMDYVAIKLVA